VYTPEPPTKPGAGSRAHYHSGRTLTDRVVGVGGAE